MAADAAALTTPIGEDAAAVLAQPSPLASFWAAFRENRGAVFGLAVFGLVVMLALAANVVAPHSPIEQFRDAVRAPPVWEAAARGDLCSEPMATVTICCRASSLGRGCRCSSVSR